MSVSTLHFLVLDRICILIIDNAVELNAQLKRFIHKHLRAIIDF